MDKIHLKCVKCGYEIERFENWIDIYDYFECILCKGKMEIEEAKFENESKNDPYEMDRLDNLLNNLATDQVAREINMIGDENVWDNIEQMKIPSQRLKYRGYFIAVGGKIPEVKFLVERDNQLFIGDE